METNAKKVEVYMGEDGYRWRALGANGEIVAEGEAHTTRGDAERAASGVLPGVPVKHVTIGNRL